ncbi:hypothetical protein [Streptomyces hiroshimensis]|uniref:Uncharacterized protein n=1 Tax=Streptomyces hiroshimensis TaxID=66424 RepID=A0ABQ2Y3J6_9ACTN|nr:hypothetical protein [Streptomyces hiroshimensis]GGX61062.1 hypothetical protein GCM10010324_02090 [Streptomyces hiroshimensis]
MAVRTATPVTGWLLRGSDGRLTAYAPAEGGVVRWTETRPGGPEWTGPELLAVPGLEPFLSIAQGAQGYVHLVGLRRRELEGGTETDIVYATQFQSGRPPTNWRSLGSPHGQDRQRSEQIGAPTAAVDSAGLHVFVRNAGGGVCGRRQDARGIWGPWADMKGSHVLDGLTAAATPAGRIELLGPASEFVLRWRQEQPGGPVRRVRNVPAKPGACSATAGVTGDDRVTHFWRDAADGSLQTLLPEPVAGEAGADAVTDTDTGAEPATVSVGGTGSGPVAVLHAVLDGHACTVLAQRAASGLPAVAVCPSGDEALAAQWSETGEEFSGAPGLALDAAGRVTVAVLGMDGHLRVARQRGDAAGLALGPWQRV